MQGFLSKIKVFIGNSLPSQESGFSGKTKIQIYREARWLWILPAESCCFCGKRTRFWSTKKSVPVCDDCANKYEERDVPTKDDWKSL